MKAVKRFDPNVGVRSFFAVHWIKAEMSIYPAQLAHR